MNIISKVIESIVDSGFRMVKLLRFGSDDNSNAFQISTFGDDFKVPEGYNALYIQTSNSSEPVCLGYINKVVFDNLNSGEKQIFSTNDKGDTLAAYIKLFNDGIIHFNGDADFIAGFNDLKSGFDTLKSDFNSFLTHMHPTAATGSPSPPSPPATPSTASIDASKKDNLKTE